MISPYSVSLQNIGFFQQSLDIHLVKGEVGLEDVVVVFLVVEILLGMEK